VPAKSGFTCVELSELFEFVVSTFAPVAEDQGHRLHAEIEAAFRSPATGDLLLQLATNLVENAFATPQAAPPLRFA
jgi:signal transduction histidine kinase